MEGVVAQSSSSYPEARLLSVGFTLSSPDEVRLYSTSDCSINYPSQLMNPFLGLPVESGKCESCGTSEPGECEGHFGYIEFPTPIFHPHHVSEMKRILSKICLNCLSIKKQKEKQTAGLSSAKISGISYQPCSKCQMFPVLIKEAKNIDGASCLELKFPKGKEPDWSFLDRYGYHYPTAPCRPLLPHEALQILENLPQDTVTALARRGCFPQSGLVLKCLPVPPNCLCVPDLPDAISSMSSDPTMSMLRRILTKADMIKRSRYGVVNFESHEIESGDLQAACAQYMQQRGAAKAPKTIEKKLREMNVCAKAWLEKIRTLFIRKGSGFSSRCVITGDAYTGIDEIGLPLEIARKITFEERVTSFNRDKLQALVDKGFCLGYKDGLCRYTMRESLKMPHSLEIGQAINRRIIDGDLVFVNRPPSTHKHSLQALSVYIHDDHVVKINPLICGALGADFDGDCIHIYYPQSLSAKAEVQELFAVEKQLQSSHNGMLNVQLVLDSVLAAKLIYKDFFIDRAQTQQLIMWTSPQLIEPAVIKANGAGPFWTFLQVLQTALPELLDCHGQRYEVTKSEFLEFEIKKGQLETYLTEIFKLILITKGPSKEVRVFNVLQPLLMEILFFHGCSLGLNDFYVPQHVMHDIGRQLQDLTPLLHFMRSTNNELVESQVDCYLKEVKRPVTQYISKSSSLGSLIDTSSDQAVSKVVQQLGFLGQQLYSRGKYYSNNLVDYFISHSRQKYIEGNQYSPESLGLVGGCLFNGLDPFEDLIHSVASREGIVRSSRGLTEPGLLFKNLMAILRNVTICYDGTVRNMCTNAIVQFTYSIRNGAAPEASFSAGEPVGVLAATAVSNPAYKAVLESSPSNSSSWDNMKEILFCKHNSKNDYVDSRVIIYLRDCDCGRTYCKEKAAVVVQNHLRRKTLKDLAAEFVVDEHCRLGLRGCGNSLRPPCIQFSYADKNGALYGGCIEKTLKMLSNAICPTLLQTVVQGDPRIDMVNILWVNPSATSWVENPTKSERGELALEVVIQRSALKNKGDAWRIAMDCCLAVMPLIDEARCIPYGIQQIQERLGISCAFDQSIQRLSSSMKNVAKGVLKEHLILVGSSMSGTGNLLGFNTTGYKALFRTFEVPVPFTESTLYTPMKCFERAAERCHSDSLCSVVASCSWGKRVALGTGASFEITWTDNQMECSDLYNFLHLVNKMPNDRELSSLCLGADVDDIDMDFCGSPNSPLNGEKLSFDEDIWDSKDDNVTAMESLGKSCWSNGSPLAVASNGWGDWGDDVQTETAKAWNTKEGSWPSCGKESKNKQVSQGVVQVEASGWPCFGAEKKQNTDPHQIDAVVVRHSFGSWDQKELQNHEYDPCSVDSSSSSWNKDEHTASSLCGGWGSKDGHSSEMDQQLGESGWICSGSAKKQTPEISPSGSLMDSHGLHSLDPKEPKNQKADSLGAPVSESWGEWSQKDELTSSKSESWECWGTTEMQQSQTNNAQPFLEKVTSSQELTATCASQSWGFSDADLKWKVSTKALETDKEKDTPRRPNPPGFAFKSGKMPNSSSHATSTSDGQIHRGAGHADASTEIPENVNKVGPLTATGKPMSMFTVDEHKILADVEPLLLSMRRILRGSSYKDGDRLSLEDQKFVLENIFHYHPNKASKISDSLDFFMVDRHGAHQKTRCLHVVSANGTREDFSYLKCIEHFVLEKYPENAEAFNKKYLAKKRRDNSESNVGTPRDGPHS
ncbi:DNA-directed RNA polymerase V subunit 1 isoform X2 [Nymphaea colorata]|uniref:DNA-directed RNA polymerase V subunit 1 isoform X2 n=1 Tax=Nymphaea colorata TaxID=210225 RepID=UPI00214E8209|nr:DNA-directed RNA polymerase V subunit 1 isoform X2 [Nymphaea colorata]